MTDRERLTALLMAGAGDCLGKGGALNCTKFADYLLEHEEAINALKQINLKRVHPFYDWEEMLEVRDIAINALEKQMPKKPLNIEETKYKVSYKCPVCGTVHVNGWCGTNWKLPFCSICGQALDWSDTE